MKGVHERDDVEERSPYDDIARDYAAANDVSYEQALREIGSLGLVHEPRPSVWKRISVAERISKHRMVKVSRATGRPVVQFNATKCPPWITKPRNRAAAKRARASRKANRP